MRASGGRAGAYRPITRRTSPSSFALPPASCALAKLSTTRSRSASVCNLPTAQKPALDSAR